MQCVYVLRGYSREIESVGVVIRLLYVCITLSVSHTVLSLIDTCRKEYISETECPPPNHGTGDTSTYSLACVCVYIFTIWATVVINTAPLSSLKYTM